MSQVQQRTQAVPGSDNLNPADYPPAGRSAGRAPADGPSPFERWRRDIGTRLGELAIRVVRRLRHGPDRSIPPVPQLLPLPSRLKIGSFELSLPTSSAPSVSVIIPVCNKVAFTLNCLRSLKQNVSSAVGYETIVVDDSSIDATAGLLPRVQGLRVIRNDSNSGFVQSCNAGARGAGAEFLCFLNNDTQVQAGWLESLVECLRAHPDAGAAGSKLIYPDGRLQEAGGIIWRDASGANFGHGQHPDEPQFNYVRPVDYCSGASLLVRREVFERLGGFSTEFAPAYYEDTDLCFRIRHELGMQVLYEPCSTIIHYEGISCGKSTESGVKRHQVVNARKFRSKWESVLSNHLPNDREKRLAASKRLCGSRTILVIDFALPRFDRESGANRLHQLIGIFRSLGLHVIFATDKGLPEQPYLGMLQSSGVEVLRSLPWRTLEDQIRERLAFVDYAWICRPWVTQKYGPLLWAQPRVKVIFDTVDVHHVRIRREAELKPSDHDLDRLWRHYLDLELTMSHRADATITVTDADKQALEAHGARDVHVVPNIHEPRAGAGLHDWPESRKDLLFIGSYEHQPNVDAVRWLCQEILPLVWREEPSIGVTLLGSDPGDAVRSLASDRVRVPGWVQDVGPYFQTHRVFVAPLRFGAGMKGKIGQSLEYGLPVVSTTIGVEGMALRHHYNVLVADTPEAFAREILRIYRDHDLWQALSRRSAEALQDYSPAAVRRQVESVFNSLQRPCL